MKLYLFILSAILLLDCNAQEKSKIENHFKGKNYTTFISESSTELAKLRKLYIDAPTHQKDSIISKTSDFLIERTVFGCFHYWVGTTWDFNGYTNTPRTGTIACGYFVSTTLKHLGFNLNRYKLAQKGATDEAIYLCGKENLTTYRDITPEQLKVNFQRNFKPGLFLVGLANHVGYIYFDGNEIYFIHSNYGTPYSVVIEKFIESEVSSSSIYVIAPISGNKKLMEKWLKNELIPIP